MGLRETDTPKGLSEMKRKRGRMEKGETSERKGQPLKGS